MKPRKSRGSYAVEFALVAPIFLTILSGIVEYGNYYSQQMRIVGVARDAARVGAATMKKNEQGSPESTAKSVAIAKMRHQAWDDQAQFSATLSGSAPDGAPQGGCVKVSGGPPLGILLS